MYSDPIIEELHRIRAELAAKFNYDLRAIVEDARRRQAESGRPTIRIKRETVPPESDESDSTKTTHEKPR